MFIKIKALGLAVIACFSLGDAFAGNTTRWGGSVDVNLASNGSGSASGVLSITYNNILNGVYGSSQPYMGCQSYSNGSMFCQAMDADSNLGSCSSDSAFLAQSVKMIMPDTRMSFEWNQNGECTALRVVHSSRLEDKQH